MESERSWLRSNVKKTKILLILILVDLIVGSENVKMKISQKTHVSKSGI